MAQRMIEIKFAVFSAVVWCSGIGVGVEWRLFELSKPMFVIPKQITVYGPRQ
jgi:hypothetical protein